MFQKLSKKSKKKFPSFFSFSLLTVEVGQLIFRYIPPYTSFLPTEEDGEASSSWENGQRGSKRRGWAKRLQLSQLSYLVICIVLICIIERKKMSQDPLNFNVLNIVIEVIRQVSTPMIANNSPPRSLTFACHPEHVGLLIHDQVSIRKLDFFFH